MYPLATSIAICDGSQMQYGYRFQMIVLLGLLVRTSYSAAAIMENHRGSVDCDLRWDIDTDRLCPPMIKLAGLGNMYILCIILPIWGLKRNSLFELFDDSFSMYGRFVTYILFQAWESLFEIAHLPKLVICWNYLVYESICPPEYKRGYLHIERGEKQREI